MKQLKICPVRAYLSRKMDLLSENVSLLILRMLMPYSKWAHKAKEQKPKPMKEFPYGINN